MKLTLSTQPSTNAVTLLALATALLLTACGNKQSDTADIVQAPDIPPSEVMATHTPPPEYPLELACANIGGQALLSVVIGIEGKPTQVTVIRSSGNAQLDKLAEERIPSWLFKPAIRHGQPVVRTIQVPMTFTPPTMRPDECLLLDDKSRGTSVIVLSAA